MIYGVIHLGTLRSPRLSKWDGYKGSVRDWVGWPSFFGILDASRGVLYNLAICTYYQYLLRSDAGS